MCDRGCTLSWVVSTVALRLSYVNCFSQCLSLTPLSSGDIVKPLSCYAHVVTALPNVLDVLFVHILRLFELSHSLLRHTVDLRFYLHFWAFIVFAFLSACVALRIINIIITKRRLSTLRLQPMRRLAWLSSSINIVPKVGNLSLSSHDFFNCSLKQYHHRFRLSVMNLIVDADAVRLFSPSSFNPSNASRSRFCHHHRGTSCFYSLSFLCS